MELTSFIWMQYWRVSRCDEKFSGVNGRGEIRDSYFGTVVLEFIEFTTVHINYQLPFAFLMGYSLFCQEYFG